MSVVRGEWIVKVSVRVRITRVNGCVCVCVCVCVRMNEWVSARFTTKHVSIAAIVALGAPSRLF